MLEHEGWVEHSHAALTHAHPHYHVTHNLNEATGHIEHNASVHEHAHRHFPLTHAHLPHVDFEREHLGEAHDHDHRTASFSTWLRHRPTET